MCSLRFVMVPATLLFILSPLEYSFSAADNETGQSEVKFENKAWVPNRTEKHRELMDALAFEIFSVNVEELAGRDLVLITRDLIDQFGRPAVRSVEQYDHPDPSDSEHTKIENIAWEFPGMSFYVVSYPPVEDHFPEAVQLDRVEITSPVYELKHGLRVGQNINTFTSLLGPPNEKNPEKVEYHVEDWMEYRNVINITSYQINMFLDSNANVVKIVWTWEGVYH